ncbi:hypothetical protein [Stappia indica]|uniref:hypothetical protein n=1 Tax=Stappia indica TaxID=538381 RepID=UPI00083620EB|nr:hypothetical protein [Stappia indica]
MAEKRTHEERRDRLEKNPAWEARHRNDAGGVLADNTSGLPDRSNDLREGSPGETDPVHGSGYQEPAEVAHPNFPDQGEDFPAATGLSDDKVERQTARMNDETSMRKNERPAGSRQATEKRS